MIKNSALNPWAKGAAHNLLFPLSRQPICVYTFFKRLAVEMCLSLFLGLDFNQSDASIITELTTSHWHGKPLFIFVPQKYEFNALLANSKFLSMKTTKAFENTEVPFNKFKNCYK